MLISQFQNFLLTAGAAHRLHSGIETNADDAMLARESAAKSLAHLREVMDRFHRFFGVYEDVSSPGNHFHTWSQFIGGNAKVSMNGSWKDSAIGATSIRCELQGTGNDFGGFALLNGILEGNDRSPRPNFGTVLNAGFNLSGATALKFKARGEKGGEVVSFFMGGVGWTDSIIDPAVKDKCTPEYPHPCLAPDSTPAVELYNLPLTKEWKEYTINLTGINLSYIIGGFGWGASVANNRNGAIFYLDDIRYELNDVRRAQRLSEPRFLRSYTTLGQPDIADSNKDDDIDLVLRNTAFVYDNALALLAFLADGSADSLRRARLIGDALVYAMQHDRFLNDGRLRSSYAAGDISLPPGWRPNGRVGTVPMPGFYDETSQRFYETAEASTVDVGNNAWAMIALLALYQHTGNQCYLDSARRLGNVIRTYRHNSGTYQGFLGGTENIEALTPEAPILRGYASAEHSIDIYAAFSAMFQITGEARWQADAEHARILVEKMWDQTNSCYWSGTVNEETIYTPIVNPGQPFLIPVDVQAWSVMSLPDTLKLHPNVLDCAERNHRNTHHNFIGYDFNNDKDGVWFEGTAQMAVAYEMAGKTAMAQSIREQLRKAQVPASFPPSPSGFISDGNGTPAACHDGLTTGFDPPEGIFHYSRRLHVGATSWNVFAQLKVNPYYQAARTSACSILGFKPAANTNLEAAARSVTTADFDSDGNADLAFGAAQNRITVLLNDARGGFRRRDYTAPTPVPYDFIAAADVNKDAKTDLLTVANGSSASDGFVTVWLNNGDGTFRFYANSPAGGRPKTLAFGHFTDDDNLDLAVLSTDGATGKVVALTGDGTGRFGAPKTIDLGTPSPTAIALGDFDRDGNLDLFAGKGNAREIALALGAGAGNFGRPTSFNAGGIPSHLAIGDFNKDGRLDLALPNTVTNRVNVLLANRVGGFGPPQEVNVGMGIPATITVGDVNWDCHADLVVTMKSGGVAVLLGSGDGKFDLATSLTAGTESSTTVIADLNGDARLDLAVANVSPGNVSVLLNDCIASSNLAVVSAASFSRFWQAPESIVSAFGAGLADQTAVATTLPLPTTLAGATLAVKGSAGPELNAPLFFASPTQINFLIPKETTSGLATLTVTKGGKVVSQGAIQIDMVAPGLFSANSSGQGVASGVALRFRADGAQATERIAVFDPMQNKFVPSPIDLGPTSDQVFLVLFGTGIRYRSSLSAVSAKIGDVNAESLYAGQVTGFEGLDQVNLRIPRSLAGRGEVEIALMVDGKAANTVTCSVK
jgi:uncharacterized protein (TIGR03437 family)